MAETDMKFINASSEKAALAKSMVEDLQDQFVNRLREIARALDVDVSFEPVNYYRDEGRHGGGTRYVASEGALFNRASINVSHVHYDDEPEKKLTSATALSCIIHPHNPLAPSLHLHISWTEFKHGRGYWRIMADLKPAIENARDKEEFINALRAVAPHQYLEAATQGDRYFFIPALSRHRGVSHYYLEEYNTADHSADLVLARTIAASTISCYSSILQRAAVRDAGADDYQKQLSYHTVYLLQVLTLDRGTTAGLLVHDQNDIGTLGSLPAKIDRELLRSWLDKLPKPQHELLDGILAALPEESPCPIEDEQKQAFANVIREFYQAHPEALELQASGGITPTTIDNHK